MIGIGLGLGVGISNRYKRVFRDSFNRPDGTLGISDTGQTWRWFTGAVSIVNNQACQLGGSSRSYIETGINNCKVTVQVPVLPGTTDKQCGILARYSGVNGGFIRVLINGLTIVLSRLVGGTTSTVLGSITFTPTPTDKISLQIDNDNVSVLINDIVVISVTESYNQTETKHGILFNDTVAKIDNFMVEPV